jgi:single-strand DNA-binding protein
VFECKQRWLLAGGCEPVIESRRATSTGNGNRQVADLAWPQEGAMSDNSVTLVGNLTDGPELRFTPNGIAVASIRLAVTPRIREREGWKDGETSFFRVNVWRDLAEHVADSLSKGDRAVVVGRLRTRAWETPAGDKRSVVEVEADEIGPSLKFATAKPQQTRELASAT